MSPQVFEKITCGYLTLALSTEGYCCFYLDFPLYEHVLCVTFELMQGALSLRLLCNDDMAG